mmetsp:Transcript_8350/g.16553  ORF Transcript_8350/g.16553 Transcript_8350/m.16553 type:complete len:166 (+) Transcript_8350:992-1489(+)
MKGVKAPAKPSHKRTSPTGQRETSPAEESKKPTSRFTSKPSAKLSIKAADPFAPKNKSKTNFGYVYSAGGIPCRINHGSIANKLTWEVDPSQLPYDPLIVTCFEGLMETEHPYCFAARKCTQELLQAEGAGEKTVPLLARLIMPLRMALMSREKTVFTAGIEALK